RKARGFTLEELKDRLATPFGKNHVLIPPAILRARDGVEIPNLRERARRQFPDMEFDPASRSGATFDIAGNLTELFDPTIPVGFWMFYRVQRADGDAWALLLPMYFFDYVLTKIAYWVPKKVNNFLSRLIHRRIKPSKTIQNPSPTVKSVSPAAAQKIPRKNGFVPLSLLMSLVSVASLGSILLSSQMAMGWLISWYGKIIVGVVAYLLIETAQMLWSKDKRAYIRARPSSMKTYRMFQAIGVGLALAFLAFQMRIDPPADFSQFWLALGSCVLLTYYVSGFIGLFVWSVFFGAVQIH